MSFNAGGQTKELGAELAMKKVGQALLAVACVLLLGFGLFFAVRAAWLVLVAVDTNLAVALIAGGATVLTSTAAVVLGRYFERKRDIEAHFRADKIKIYDEFLQEFFKLFDTDKAEKAGTAQATSDASDNLVRFLRDWQRKLIIWGGHDVLRKYFEWANHMKRGTVDIRTVLLMDDFFRALRADIGLSSTGLVRGAFANLILRHADLLGEVLELLEKGLGCTLA